MKIIHFSIVCFALYIPIFAQDCNDVNLNVVSIDECLPVAEIQLKGTAPSGASATWSTSAQTGINLNLNKDSDLAVSAQINKAGTYQISMKVTLPNGLECTENHEQEIFGIPELKTNIQNEYKLCNNLNIVPFSVLNSDEFQSITWIVKNNYYRQSDVQIAFNKVGTQKLILQAIDTRGCSVQNQVDIKIVEGPSPDNVSGQLNASIEDLNCLETGSKHELTTEITSLEPVNHIYWPNSSNTTGTDYSFEVTVGTDDVFTYPIKLIYDECQVALTINHPYSINYQTNFSNPYEGRELCKGESITLTNTTPYSEGVTNFTWAIENAQIISESSEKITFYYNNQGTYNWQLNYSGECPSNTKESATINIAGSDQYPTSASINSDNLSSCKIPFDLSINQSSEAPPSGNLSYHWSLYAENTVVTNLNSEIFDYEIQNPGNYHLILETENDALKCTTKDTLLISVDDLNLDINLTSTSECSGYEFSPMEFAENQLDESVVYDWKIVSDESVLESSALKSPTFIMEEPGVHDLSLKLYSTINPNCEKTISEKKLITINKNPELELSSEKLDVCTFPYQAIIEDTSIFDGDYGWVLYDDLWTTLSADNNNGFTYTFNKPGTYRLHWKNENTTECSTEQEVLINLDDLQIDLDDSKPFVGQCYPYEFSPKTIDRTKDLNGAYTYQWELIHSSGEVYQTLTESDGTFYVDEVDTYDLQLSVFNQDRSCFDQVKLDDFVEVNSYDLEMGVLNSNSCFNDAAYVDKTFHAKFITPPDINTYYYWSVEPSDAINILSESRDTLKLRVNEAGNYSVKYTAFIENSECIYNKELYLGVGAKAEINTSTQICLDKLFSINDKPSSAVGTNTSFAWSTPDNDLNISDTNERTAKVSTEKPGIYTIELTVQNNLGCTGSTSASIEAYELDASFSSPNAGEQCKPAIITLNSLNNEYINSYTWNLYETNFLGVESGKTLKTFEPILETLLNEIADYDVELIIESIHGCSDTTIRKEDYINLISPRPYFTVDEKMVCDTLRVELHDDSKFMDAFYPDYGNNAQTNYTLNETNQVSYTYPEGGTEPVVEYEISLIGEYASCVDTFKYTIKMEKPTLPPAPEINYVSVISNGKVAIEWSTQNLDNSFSAMHLYHYTNNNPPSFIESSGQINPNQFLHKTPTNAINNYNISLEDTCKRVSNYSTKHATMLLETETSSYETIDLNWSPYIGWNQLTSYTIYRSVDGSPYEILKEVPRHKLSYTDTYLCNVVYGYYVVANHPSKSYKPKSNVSLIEPMYVQFNKPLKLTNSSVYMDSSIISNWETHSNYKSTSNSYLIDRWDQYFGWITHYAETTEPPFIDQNVDVNHANYRYRVKYTDKCGNIGPLSNYGENIVLKGKQYPSHFELYWNSYGEWETGVQKYTVQYYNALKNRFEDIRDITDTHFIDNQLKKEGVEEKYCFRIMATKAQDALVKSISNTICFIPEPKDYFPNTFTPNKDGINETFKYEGNFAKALKTKIYSRWGILVYESDEVEFKWDGKDLKTGETCANGTYFLHYELTGFDGTVIKNNKLIFLIR